MAQHQQAAAALLHQQPDPYAFLHSPPPAFHGYGSLPQYAALTPRPPMAGRPSSSIAFGGQGGSLGGGLPPLPRPATSGAVYRSTSEWGQLSAAQKEAAQVGLCTCAPSMGWAWVQAARAALCEVPCARRVCL